MLIIPATCFGLAAGWIAWTLIDIVTSPREVDAREGRFEETRRDQLRRASPTYRWFEPWIDELSAGIQASGRQKLDDLKKHLVSAGTDLPWRPAEFLAMRRVEALLAGLAGGCLGWLLGGWGPTLALGIAGFFGYQVVSRRLLRSQAIRRRIAIKRRFSSVIDLMALMMEVGGNFQESLEMAAREMHGHPLGDELEAVQRDIELGRPRVQALGSFAERIDEDDINEVISAIVEGEELGTPLSNTLRIQADQLREKRSQWAEKAAEESKVALVFPAMIVMVACLITVAAPFVLAVIYSSEGM